MKKTVALLKTYFETGDQPTESQFADLIDSFLHKDTGVVIRSHTVANNGDITVDFSDNTSITIEKYKHPDGHTQSEVIGLVTKLQQIDTAITALQTEKVNTVNGKGLSTNDFTNALKTKLQGLRNYSPPASHPISFITGLQTALNTINASLTDKVDKETGKGLSQNDYTNAEKKDVSDNKLAVATLESGKVNILNDLAVGDAVKPHTLYKYNDEIKYALVSIASFATGNWSEASKFIDIGVSGDNSYIIYKNRNLGVGYGNLGKLTTGHFNTAVGDSALRDNTIGHLNTAVGNTSLQNNTTGNRNTAVGDAALIDNTAGHFNTAVGDDALRNNTTGASNTAVGDGSLVITSRGNPNTAYTNSSGLGAYARVSGSNQVQLGDSKTTTYVYGSVQNRSDRRDKADIADLTEGLDFINALRAVKFKWDYRDDYIEVQKDGKAKKLPKDGSKKRNRFHTGLIAQEIKKALDEQKIDYGFYQDHSVSGGEDVRSIAYEGLVPHLIKAVQELYAGLKTDLPLAVAQSSINELLNPIVEAYVKKKAEAWYENSLPIQGDNIDWDTSTNKITKIYDKTLSQSHANQSNVNLHAKLSTNKQNKRRFLEFENNRYITDINLNAENVCCFIVQKLKAAPSGNVSNGMFGHDNGGWDRFAFFWHGNFGIGGATATPQTFQGKRNANPTDTKINCISVGWYGKKAKESEVWCNGKLLGNFTGSGNEGSTKMTLGDLNPDGMAAFGGNIYEFIVFKNKLSQDRTRQIHEYLRQKWGITHWDDIDLTLTGK